MKMIMWAFYSFLMTVFNLTSIIGGFYIFKAFRFSNQMVVQSFIAIIINIMILFVWYYINNLYLKSYGMVIKAIKNLIYVSLAGMLWTPFVFIPIHFVTQGYMTSFENIIAIWIYQAVMCTILFIGDSIKSIAELFNKNVGVLKR